MPGLYIQNRNTPCIIRVSILAFLWVFSTIVGWLVSSNDTHILSLMPAATQCSLSIIGVLTISILPLVITIAGLVTNKFVIIYILYIIKAFSAGYLLYAISCVYGSSGWLIQSLLLFSGNWTCLLILWITFRHIRHRSRALSKDAFFSIVACFAIAIIDYLYIAPFLRTVTG